MTNVLRMADQATIITLWHRRWSQRRIFGTDLSQSTSGALLSSSLDGQTRQSAHLHVDETGWRVDGNTHWLWCFTNDRNCDYTIDRSRSSPVLQQFFTTEFEGVLITDFWSPSESVCAEDRQCCLVHLLRELEQVDAFNGSDEWCAFSKKLRRLLRDGIRLRKRDDFAPGKFPSLVERLTQLAAKCTMAPDTDPAATPLHRHAISGLYGPRSIRSTALGPRAPSVVPTLSSTAERRAAFDIAGKGAMTYRTSCVDVALCSRRR